jgi:adenosylcobyric acid synthase
VIERLHPSPPAANGGRTALAVDLSASLNPLGPSPLALAAACSAGLTRYPDPDAGGLADAAARRHGIPARCVVPVPGASWGLWLCLVAYGGRGLRCAGLGPCFGEYRRAAEIAGCDYRETPAGLEAALASAPDLLVLGNPSNPAAGALAAGTLGSACAAHPRTLFVVDEAFAAFAPPGTSLVDGRVPPANAIVVRSLTKELGLPGLRMGYLVAGEERAARLRDALPAWPLSSPALAAATAGCADLDHVRAGAETGREHVRLLSAALAGAGAEVSPSCANYVLCRAPGLVGSLARRGVAGRDCASFGLRDHVRLAAPAPGELALVLEAIGSFAP